MVIFVMFGEFVESVAVQWGIAREESSQRRAKRASSRINSRCAPVGVGGWNEQTRRRAALKIDLVCARTRRHVASTRIRAQKAEEQVPTRASFRTINAKTHRWLECEFVNAARVKRKRRHWQFYRGVSLIEGPLTTRAIYSAIVNALLEFLPVGWLARLRIFYFRSSLCKKGLVSEILVSAPGTRRW